MRRRASPVTEISVSTAEVSVTGMKTFPYEHFIPVTEMKKNSNTITHFRDRTDNSSSRGKDMIVLRFV